MPIDPSTATGVIPEPVRDTVNKVMHSISNLSNTEAEMFITELTVKNEDGTYRYPKFIIDKAAEAWFRSNCGKTGKRWRYFMGICNSILEEQSSKSQALGAVPPRKRRGG